MSKLINFKEWFTIADTAKYLSKAISEEVTEADVLRFGLEKKLTLSINIVSQVYGCKGKIVPWHETDWYIGSSECKSSFDDVLKLETACCNGTQPTKLVNLITSLPTNECINAIPILKNIKIDEDEYLDIEDTVEVISGVWDIKMVGGLAKDVMKHMNQTLFNDTNLFSNKLEARFVERDGTCYQIMESYVKSTYDGPTTASGSTKQIIILPTMAEKLRQRYKDVREHYLKMRNGATFLHDYFPARGLPNDSILVVKSTAIKDLLESLNGKPSAEKHSSTREINSLLKLISAFCKEAKFDINRKGTASALAVFTQQHGISLSEDTVMKIIKQIKKTKQ